MAAIAPSFDLRDDTLVPRRTLTLRAARRRSFAVRAFRAGLVLAMAAIVALIGGYVAVHAFGSRPVLEQADTSGILRTKNPHFTGRDSVGEPYVITADAAVRRPEDAGLVYLEGPRMSYVGDEDKPGSVVTAQSGVYDEGGRTLDLYGEVRFSTENGYDFRTSHARAFVAEGRVLGEEPVEGAGPLGSVTALSFEIWDSGARIVFKTDVVARLERDLNPRPPLRDAAAVDTTEEAIR